MREYSDGKSAPSSRLSTTICVHKFIFDKLCPPILSTNERK